MATTRARIRFGERVSPLELFFDLVFVFAITQVTALMAARPTWAGLAQGLLVLAVVWWTWAGYAWLTNTMDPEDGLVRVAIFGAMGAMLLVSLAVPGAFGDDALLFAIAYLLVRVAHIVVFACSRARPSVGSRMPISTAIIPITTKSSTSVKPPFPRTRTPSPRACASFIDLSNQQSSAAGG